LAITVRALESSDGMKILAIYAEAIKSAHATFETNVPTWTEFNRAHLPMHRFVAVNEAKKIVATEITALAHGRPPTAPSRHSPIALPDVRTGYSCSRRGPCWSHRPNTDCHTIGRGFDPGRTTALFAGVRATTANCRRSDASPA